MKKNEKLFGEGGGQMVASSLGAELICQIPINQPLHHVSLYESDEQIGSLYGENPALCLGIKDRGKIEVGRRADFTIMDNDYNVLQTIIKGETYYKA